MPGKMALPMDGGQVMITGVQVSSLRPLLKTPEQVTGAFVRLAQMGCKTVQLQWIDPAVSPAQIAQALHTAGLVSVSVQDFSTEIMANLAYYTRLCTLTGSTWLCVSRIPEPYHSAGGIAAYAGELDNLYAAIAPMGLRLCFHPVTSDYQMIGKETLVDRLLRTVRSPVELCLDLYHIHKGGLSMPGMLHQYDGRVRMVHFKDYAVTPQGPVLVPAGQGEIDWRPAVDACLETKVPYGFVEQESWTRDPFDCMREALAWLDGQARQEDGSP